MLRINRRGARGSAKYYTDILSKSYYGQENPGIWHGKSAELLGPGRGDTETRPQDGDNVRAENQS